MPLTATERLMKCQSCDNPATLHVTELIAGEPVEYHVCEAHGQDLDASKSAIQPDRRTSGFAAFLADPAFRDALLDPEVRTDWKSVLRHLSTED